MFYGGAIYIEDSSIVLKSGSTRSNNTAYVGGAIKATRSTIKTTEGNGIIVFKNNIAEFFAAALDIVESRVTLKNVNFFQNIAEYLSIFSINGHFTNDFAISLRDLYYITYNLPFLIHVVYP